MTDRCNPVRHGARNRPMKKESAPVERNAWLLVRPAKDRPDIWIAHCIDLDLMAEGSSFEKALEQLRKVVISAVRHDVISRNVDPFESRNTVDPRWLDCLHLVQREGRQVPLDQIKAETKKGPWVVALQMTIKYSKPQRLAPIIPINVKAMRRAAWKLQKAA